MLKVPAPDPTRTNWCGPTALAILSGLTYAEARDVCAAAKVKRGRSTKRVVKGFARPAMLRALSRVGAKLVGKWHSPAERITFQRLDEHLRPRRFYLVSSGCHYITVNTHDWTACCNWTRAWVPLKDHPFNRTRVAQWLEVVPAPAAFASIDTPTTYYLAA